LPLEHGGSEERCVACGFRFQDAERPQRPIPVQGEKVLCIEDEWLIRYSLAESLKAHGFVPLTAPDGATGLALAAAERPRLILVDIMLPDIDGFEVCRRLRADPRTRGSALIILTALGDPTLNIRAFRAGADLVLTKPVATDTLIATLRAALALQQDEPPPGGRDSA
jgi:DNA-binding response OmpR family regulator